jgi:SpoIID/LytB domain protein
MAPVMLLALVVALWPPPAIGQADAREPVRVEVLSLLVPRRVVIGSPDGPAGLPHGGVLAPGGRLVADTDGDAVVARSAGGWTWRGERLVVGEPGCRLSLDVRGRDRRVRDVRGRLTISSDGRALRIVVEEDLEDLVAGAVAAELDGVTEPAALEAAAVAFRSYIVANRGRHAAEGFDLCDTTHCLFSRGIPDPAASASHAAVAATSATRGLVLVRAGHVVAGYCTACCGGRTSTPADVWGSPDTGDYAAVSCAFCRSSRYYRWRRSAGFGAVADAVGPLAGRRLAADAAFDVVPGPGGWVRWVVVRSEGQETRVAGDAFRMAVERRLGWDTIPSPRFTIERDRGRLRFAGGGYGHGIGLCVAGAVARARRGASRDAILAAYFPRVHAELLRQAP